jgi:hypothetical protein
MLFRTPLNTNDLKEF